ncbi:MAG: hypothetical protein P4L51_05305 [Puia sp.]|nr:hypothetical protein [Puia sp.]
MIKISKQLRTGFAVFLPVVFLACGNTGRGSSGGPGPADAVAMGPVVPAVSCTSPQKITAIYKDHVYDLAGYADEGKGDPFNLFDENAYVDPRADSKPVGAASAYTPLTDPQPRFAREIYFPSGKGSRIVTDLQIPYKLSEVYVYDRSRSADSVWIYTGNMNNWKLRAAFTTRDDPSQWGWRRFSLGDSAQYVMIRFSSFEIRITEMVLYGCPYGQPPPPSSTVYQGARLPKKRMKEFLGANYFVEQEPAWVRPFHENRVYTYASYFDDDTVNEYPHNRYDLRHFGFWNTGLRQYSYFMDDLHKANGARTWYSIRGPSLWLARQGFTDKDRPLTKPGMDPEDTRSYARHANMMWHLAAFFGHTRVDTNLLSLSHSPRRSGLGLMSLYENGNEEDAWWVGSRYCSPMEYFAQSSADYDGAEGALGARTGIKQADPGSDLMTSGIIGLDTNRIKVYAFLCKTLRNDKAFLWQGGIQYHHYSNNGQVAITPEEDSLRWKLSHTRDFTYRVAPGVECILGENGYDKGRASRQAAPLLPGYTSAQSQGILILRSINATAFSGFDRYVLYWLRDFDNEDIPDVYGTSGVLRVFSKDSVHYYPGWYYISTFVNRLADFVPDTIVQEQGPVWIYKYRHASSPDSVAYFIYCPTRRGVHISQYPLTVGSRTTGGSAEVISFPDDSLTGRQTTRPITDGKVLVDVEEKPKLVMIVEKGAR